MPTATLSLPLRLRGSFHGGAPISTTLDLNGLLGEAAAGREVAAVRLRDPAGAELPVDFAAGSDGRLQLTWLTAPGLGQLTLEADLRDPESERPASPRPLVQVTHEPGRRLDFSAGGRLLLTYHYDPVDGKPFFHPIAAPGGGPLTRMGDPSDPQGRRHLNGLWIAHRLVDELNFWDDTPGNGRQRHVGVTHLSDGRLSAAAEAMLHWERPDGEALLIERRAMRVYPLPDDELLLDLELELSAADEAVRLGRTPFGLLAVRVARGLAAAQGGRIETSAGAVGEGEAMHTRARWCGFSGQVAEARVGLAILDHEGNPHHPCYWHTRGDGWMGAAVGYDGELSVEPGTPLRFRYRLLAHRGEAAEADLAARFEEYSQPPRVEPGEPRLVSTEDA